MTYFRIKKILTISILIYANFIFGQKIKSETIFTNEYYLNNFQNFLDRELRSFTTIEIFHGFSTYYIDITNNKIDSIYFVSTGTEKLSTEKLNKKVINTLNKTKGMWNLNDLGVNKKFTISVNIYSDFKYFINNKYGDNLTHILGSIYGREYGLIGHDQFLVIDNKIIAPPIYLCDFRER